MITGDVIILPMYSPSLCGRSIADHYPASGDIVISVDTAEKQALALGHSTDDEIDELLLHGLLHLLGYDHDADESDLWYNKQQELIGKLKSRNIPYVPQGISKE